MSGPKAQVVVLAREDREKLERIERGATSEQREVLRARIILQAAEAASNEAISRNLGITDDTARKWRARYAAEGMQGLRDRRRRGRPARLDGVVRCRPERRGAALTAGAAGGGGRVRPRGSPDGSTRARTPAAQASGATWLP
jgi:hypothetical protein